MFSYQLHFLSQSSMFYLNILYVNFVVSESLKFMCLTSSVHQNNGLLTYINPLNAELNPICHLLALLGSATIVVVSRLRVKIDLNEKFCFARTAHILTINT